jgi:HPt (histidine-containing phosphotransfer) domain-containing protein
MEENKIKHIDFTYINEVTDGDKDALAKILKLFIRQVNDNINELLNGLHDNDYHKICFYAHKAKNDLLVVGMKTLSIKMKELETLAKKNENSPLFAQLISLYIKDTQIAISEINEIFKFDSNYDI